MKRIVAVVISICLTICCGLINNSDTKADSYGLSNPRIANNNTTWDCIYFGNYFQSNKTTKEPIKWRVLSVDGNQGLLLSDKILDMYQFTLSEYANPIVWETSGIRKWLNNYFYNNAFSAGERNSIILSKLINEDFSSTYYAYDNNIHEDGGPDTEDYVFNLSFNEANNKAYGFVSNDPDDNCFYTETRYAERTTYAQNGGVVGYLRLPTPYNDWMLRNPGFNHNILSINEASPTFIYYSNNDTFGVRPAIRIDLSKGGWTSAGTFTATHDYIERHNKSTTNTTTKKTKKVTVAKTKIKSIKAKKKALKIVWSKAKGVSGYKLQYSLKKGMSPAKTITIKKASITSKTIKGLKKKKKYYVRIKAYKKVSGKTYYSSWSSKKSKKTK